MTDDTTARSSSGQHALPRTALAWVEYLREQADEAGQAGDTQFAKHLESLATRLEHGSWQNFLDYEKEVKLSNLRDWEGQWRHYRDWQLDNQRQVIGLAQSALRGFAIINAGAIVALLAFLGNVWTKGITLEPFLVSMWAFALGVVLSALASALSYLTQLLYGSESEKTQKVAAGFHVVTVLVAMALT